MTRTRLGILAVGGVVVVLAALMLGGSGPDYSKIPVQTAADLGRELEQLRERLDIPGLSAAIAIDGRIVWARGFGWADLERHVAVNPDTTSFHLASLAKPYAATVVLQLADEGRLRLYHEFPISVFRCLVANRSVCGICCHIHPRKDREPLIVTTHEPSAFSRRLLNASPAGHLPRS